MNVVKRGSTLFLRGVVLLMGVIALAFGGLTTYTAIFNERTGYYVPVLIGVTLSVIPFIVAVFQTLRLLNLIDQGKAFSQLSVQTLKYIKYCGVVFSSMYILGMPYVYYAANRDDAPGVILIGLMFIFAGSVVTTFAAVLERLLQDALDLKSENDLTV